MPFTPAHASIVLPLIKKRWFSATALIIGSASPDFEYFFKMSVSSVHSHRWLGVLYFNLPVVLLLSLIFHQVVKRNLIFNLPLFLQKRFTDTLTFDFIDYLRKHWLIFSISAVIGAASHILWDSFTHGGGYFVRTLPFYRISVYYDGARYPMFYALQHISTAVGLLVLLIYVVLKPAASKPMAQPRLVYWISTAAIALGIVALRFIISPHDFHIGNQVVSAITGLCIALVIGGLINFRNVTQMDSYGEEDTIGASR